MLHYNSLWGTHLSEEEKMRRRTEHGKEEEGVVTWGESKSVEKNLAQVSQQSYLSPTLWKKANSREVKKLSVGGEVKSK